HAHFVLYRLRSLILQARSLSWVADGVRPEDSRGRKRARQRNRFLPEMLRSWSPPHKVGAPFSIFRDGPFGGFGNVRHNRIRMTFAKPPDLQPTPDAARQQRPTCLKLGIRCLVDQHRAAAADAIALTPLAPDGCRLDIDPVGHVMSPVGLVRNGDADATPPTHAD